MITIAVHDFASWRAQARRLLAENRRAEEILWLEDQVPQAALPFQATEPASPAPKRLSPRRWHAPRRFVELAAMAAWHRAPGRWQVMYRVLWRLCHEGRHVLDLASDEDVHALDGMAAEVRRDEHKMRAFVRFTPVTGDEGVRYVAWYQPDHRIVRLAAPFFADRFSSMRWSILTPDLSAHWDLERLSFTAGTPAPVDADGGDIEALWRTYYAAVFNPARANLAATLREMPLRRWARLPEAALIPSLLHSAHEQTLSLDRSAAATSARSFVPATRDLADLRAAATGCRGCGLHARATQTVFGEGPPTAPLVLVGEQPGDAEDLQGRPFTGPAGAILDQALIAAGIDRGSVYVTNAVKHFSFEERGKRRIHKTPRASEMRACRPWLEAEIHAIRPAGIVCLGSTAARALLGPQARVMQMRGRPVSDTAWAPTVVVTVHPSAVLRADDGERYFAMLVADLRVAAAALTPKPVSLRTETDELL